MKKIPTLFERVYYGHKIIDILPNITPGCEEAFINGDATVKIDGSCCAIIDGTLYKRYDCKKGKTPPEGAIACCDPDPVTGHWPHWVKVSMSDPSDKWFADAYKNTFSEKPAEHGIVTYEAIGPHFQGNPYGLSLDILEPHGRIVETALDRTFEGVKSYLEEHEIEGIVFWLNGEPVCKIKRSDFGLEWPIKKR